MNIFRSAGFAVGLMIGLVLIVILFKLINKDHKLKTEYDERQKIIRGKAYMYSFYAIIAYEVVMILFDLAEVSFPLQGSILHFGAILFGCMVLACYSIWTGAYWGLNNDRKKYAVIFVILGIFNLVPVWAAYKSGELIQNGRLGTPFINLMVVIMMFVLGAEMIVKLIVDARTAEEE